MTAEVPAEATVDTPPRPVVDARPNTALTLLRAGAAVLVGYGYLVGLWLALHDTNPQPVAGIREWLNRPLRLGEDFGPFAIMVLLLCTGYTAATPGGLGRRLLRGYLPVLVATLLAAGALAAGLTVWTEPADAGISAANLAGNLTLASHLVAGKALLVPLAWVLGLQLVAWLAGAAARGRGWPVVVLVLLAATGVVLVAANDPGLAHLGRPLCFLPLVLIGLVTAKVTGGALPRWAGLVLGAGCFALVVAVDRGFAELARWWYPVAACYAVLVFLVAVVVAGPVADRCARLAVTRWLADRAEWLLVLPGVVGFAVLGALRTPVPLLIAMLAALLATGLTADLGHRLANLLVREGR